jgi:hypothetical protein
MGATARRGFGLAGVLLTLTLAGRPAEARLPQDPLRAVLPAAGAVPGWAPDGEPQEFVGEDLYAYIDGGAEIYHEYGFRRVVVQDYKNPDGKSVSLEIFEMADPAAAFGIFTFKRSGQGKVVPLGTRAELEDYYLNLWRGRYLATLTGFDASTPTIEGLMAVAGAVDGKLGEGGAAPGLVTALPADGLRPQSVKYLKGLLGLNNVYSFFTARGLGFAEAVKGDYADGSMLIVMDYGTDAARAASWGELQAYLGASDRFLPLPDAVPGVSHFKDAKGRFLACAAAGPRLAVAVGPDPAAVSGLAIRTSR